jgi:DNA-binding MarR family transcriptional regulator
MNATDEGLSTAELLSARRMAPSAALYATYTAVNAVLGSEGMAGTEYDRQTIDLLLRLEESPQHAGRAVDLADRIMVSTSHMTRVVDKVEALGLVKRTPDPDDRRANLVTLTADGSDVVATVAPHIAATLDRIIHDTLTTEEINILIELLSRIEQQARGSGVSRSSRISRSTHA